MDFQSSPSELFKTHIDKGKPCEICGERIWNEFGHCVKCLKTSICPLFIEEKVSQISTWNCSKCTFINSSSSHCEVCGFMKNSICRSQKASPHKCNLSPKEKAINKMESRSKNTRKVSRNNRAERVFSCWERASEKNN